jgi:flagellar motor switch protein FliM
MEREPSSVDRTQAPVWRETTLNTCAYDFRNTEPLAETQVRALQTIQETLARTMAADLSVTLRTNVNLTAEQVRSTSFASLPDEFAHPVCLISLEVANCRAGAVLALDRTLVFPILEILMGGTGELSLQLERDLTGIEARLLEDFAEIVVCDINEAWKANSDAQIRFDAIETNPAAVRAFSQPGDAAVIQYKLSLGELCSGSMLLALPIVSLETPSDLPETATDRPAPEPNRSLEMLQRVPFTVDARLNGAKMKLREVVQLRVGQILHFEYDMEKPVDLVVSGKPKIRGKIVATGGHRGFVVEQFPVVEETQLRI